jgi:flavin reductase (DIM6/NTAB) family NADH-FMN oxidoreductase RutF
VIAGCAAHFFCTVASRIDGGDHVILIASVQRFDRMDREPLVFYRGSFAALDLRKS